jgi:hypothetical protein
VLAEKRRLPFPERDGRPRRMRERGHRPALDPFQSPLTVGYREAKTAGISPWRWETPYLDLTRFAVHIDRVQARRSVGDPGSNSRQFRLSPPERNMCAICHRGHQLNADADSQGGHAPMKYVFDRELPVARRRKYEIQRIALAVFLITIGWLATARADIGALPQAGGSVDAAGVPAGQPAQSEPHVNAGTSPEISDVTVTVPTPPSDQQLAGNSLYEFITHHATTHYGNSNADRNLARWRGGMQSICPLTEGLTPGYDAFVTARLRAIAAYVGAPVESNAQCKATCKYFSQRTPRKKWIPS